MELTPELLLEAKFGPSRRGYDMEEVDDFLERVAAALEVLLGRLTDEFTRAENAEAEVARLRRELEAAAAPPAAAEPAPAAEAAPAASISADEPMRILVHAERTAEAVVAEAREQAARLTTEATEVATASRQEAEAILDKAKTEAEAEARKSADAARRAAQEEVNALRGDRDALAADVRAFKRWMDEHRARVRTTVRELQRVIDDPNALRELAVPDASEVESMPAPTDDGEDDGEPTAAVPAVDLTTAADDDLVEVASGTDAPRNGSPSGD